MTHRITSILLLIAFAGQSFFVFILQADYMVRYEAYLERCVNLARPSMKCNGHCQLVLKMKQADQSQQDEQAPVRVKQPEPLSGTCEMRSIAAPIGLTLLIVTPPADAFILEGSTVSVFRPPCIG